ncbi:YdcF family protein [Nocardia sp. NPDC051570]|uniref:YdcF family protein n=1 Tax=Nocardia sp. NPDC051570 TaxID=3364324 RepID=UPI0037BACDD5
MRIARRLKYLLAACAAAFAIIGPLAPAATADPLVPLYNAAQASFLDGNDSAGLAALAELLVQNPIDAQALSLQAIWSDYVGDVLTREVALTRLGAIDANMAAGTRNVIGAIGAAMGTLPNPLPALIGPHTGIVVLGYGLLPDGSMRPELVNRLIAAWVQAIAAPWSPVVVTGGNPQNGVSEGAAMAGWLTSHGIPATRVLIEDRAGSTVQNALFGTARLRDAGADSAVVVTSPNHIRRAVGDFVVAGTRVVGAMTSLDQLVSQLPPPNRVAQRSIYLDATRTFLLPPAR